MTKNYDISLIRIIDGDSYEIDIDLGFGIWLKNQHLRLNGVDTPESRTSDLVEKKYGLLAKSFVENWCENRKLTLVIETNDDKDKFGRILGDLKNENSEYLSLAIIQNYHGVKYEGQNKYLIKEKHLENRNKLKV